MHNCEQKNCADHCLSASVHFETSMVLIWTICMLLSHDYALPRCAPSFSQVELPRKKFPWVESIDFRLRQHRRLWWRNRRVHARFCIPVMRWPVLGEFSQTCISKRMMYTFSFCPETWRARVKSVSTFVACWRSSAETLRVCRIIIRKRGLEPISRYEDSLDRNRCHR